MIPADSAGCKVMVVDQKQMVADRIAAFLRHNGFEAKATYSPDEALAVGRFWRPELILADVSEPGREVVEKNLGLCTALPDCRLVLMFSEEADVERIQYYKNQGEDFEMLPTPVDPQELIRFLSSLVEEKAA